VTSPLVSILIALAITTPALAQQPDKPAPPLPAPLDISPQVTEGIVNAPPAEVWRCFSTPEGYKNLGVAKCDMDFRIGGLIRSHYDPAGTLGDPGTIQQRILAYEPLRSLSIRIAQPPEKFPFQNAWKETWTVISLTDLGDGRTSLRITGMGYTADDESQKMREFFRTGNAWVMKKLQAHYDGSVKLDPTGKPHEDGPLAPIEVDALIKAPRADVWKMLSTSEGWKTFFGVNSKIELRPGGPFEIYFSMDPPAGSRGSEGCTVLSLVPGKMLSYTWNAPPKFAHARGGGEHTWVVITLEDAGEARTRVHLTHLGFEDLAKRETEQAEEWRQVRAYFANAWPHVLRALRRHWEPSTPQVEPTR